MQGSKLVVFRYIILFIVMLFTSHRLIAAPNSHHNLNAAFISDIQYFQTPENESLSLDQVKSYFRQGKAIQTNHQQLSLGISNKISWVRLSITNPTKTPIIHRLIAGKTWVDQLDIYFEGKNHDIKHWHSGDSNIADDYLIPGIGYIFTLDIPSGNSTIYIKAQSLDPMTLPLELFTVPQERSYNAQLHFASGLIYGILLALIGFNLVLYLTLKKQYALYYCLYISCFIIVNMSYNGFGFAWVYPDSVFIETYNTLIFMVLHGITGLIFVSNFLSAKKYSPNFYYVMVVFCISGLVGMIALVIFNNHMLATHLAFSFIFFATLLMIFSGIISFHKVEDARYFLIAVLSSMLGLLATTLSVWGVIPYNYYTYNGAVFGVVLEAIILAIIVTIRLKAVEAIRIKTQYLSSYDPLTNLFNRRSFLEFGNPLIQKANHGTAPVCLMMIDIDHFKMINDTYGHYTGDLALSHIAKLLKNNIRESDILARWGGEEIAILLPKTNIDQALVVSEHLRKIIEKTPLIHDGTTISITASFGVSMLKDGDSLETLFKRADKCLYIAKNQGRNRIAV